MIALNAYLNIMTAYSNYKMFIKKNIMKLANFFIMALN